MRIVFDVTPLSLPRTGIGNYLRGALAGLAEAAGDSHEIVALAVTGPRGVRAVPAAIEGIPAEREIRFLPPARLWRAAWSRLGRPPLERLVGAFDAFCFSDWWYPPQRAGVRATIVHDLVPLLFPELVDPRTVRLHTAKYRAVPGCDVVFVNSGFTARQVEEALGVPRERIRVVHPGIDPVFSPGGGGGGGEYVLALPGDARKNLEVLRDLPLELVIPAAYVRDEELADLYRGAAVFAYPSRYEGFGIPIVEAMACGVPVVASSHPSLDEASGDAALRADPDRPEEWRAAVARALEERDELVRRGLEHARRFTWAGMGRRLLAGLEAAAR